MQPKASLIGANRRIILYPITTVDLDFAIVIHPGNTELQKTLRLDDPLYNPGFFDIRPFLHHWFQRFQNLLHRLQKLRFALVSFANFFINLFHISALQSHAFSSFSLIICGEHSHNNIHVSIILKTISIARFFARFLPYHAKIRKSCILSRQISYHFHARKR